MVGTRKPRTWLCVLLSPAAPTSPRPAQPVAPRLAAQRRFAERLALLPCRQAPTSPTHKLLRLNVGPTNCRTELRFVEYDQKKFQAYAERPDCWEVLFPAGVKQTLSRDLNTEINQMMHTFCTVLFV
jgi:hypothetical protein